MISGRIQNDSYINRDRQAVYSVCIMVEVIDSAESKNAADGNNTTAAPTAGDDFTNIQDGIEEEFSFN